MGIRIGFTLICPNREILYMLSAAVNSFLDDGQAGGSSVVQVPVKVQVKIFPRHVRQIDDTSW